MKVISFVPFKICRRCVYNDFKKCGRDFCVRGKCIYDSGIPDKPIKEKNKEGGASGK